MVTQQIIILFFFYDVVYLKISFQAKGKTSGHQTLDLKSGQFLVMVTGLYTRSSNSSIPISIFYDRKC